MKRFVILGLAVLLVVLAWTGGWFYVSGLIRDNVAALAEGDGVSSPRLVCGDLSVGGFPFRFDIDCREAQILSGDIAVGVPGLRMSALVYQPTHIRASALGPATLENAFTGARNQLAWESLEASLRLTDWRIEQLSIVGADMAWTDTLMGESLLASTPHAEFHLLDVPEQFDAAAGLSALALYAQADGVQAPGLGIEAGEASAEAEISGLPADLRQWGGPEMLRDWAAAGGTLDIVSLQGTDGEDYINAEGELALTEAGLVNGQLAVKSKGVVEQIAPMIPQGYGEMLLGNPAEDGSYSQTINIRGGVVLSGLLPAGMIPPVF